MPYRTSSGRASRGGDGLPAWLIFLLGAALIFGLYYLWQGAQNFLRTGGLGVDETTRQAVVVGSATARRVTQGLSSEATRTRPPTVSPIPPCQTFTVSVPNAIVREGPSSASGIVTSYKEGDTVCVISIAPDSEWYLIDMTPETRRLDPAYMHQTVIRANNPTPKPTITMTPLPTVTSLPTLTPSMTPEPRPSATPNLSVTDTETPTPTSPPTATDIRQSA